MSQPNYLTPEGLEKIKEELEQLRTVRRHEVASRIHESRERGGIASNAEYEDAKNELAFTEGRILTLENLINSATIIKKKTSKDTVEVGSRVTVKNQQGKNVRYTITGRTEADPAQGKISNASPIGLGLLGKHVGDVAEVKVPSGTIKLEIVAIA